MGRRVIIDVFGRRMDVSRRGGWAVLEATWDNTDPHSVFIHLRSLGVRAEEVLIWRGEQTAEVRLRAPAGVGPYQLDHAPGMWTRAWIRDVCRSDAWAMVYASQIAGESETAAQAARRAQDALETLARAFPQPAVVEAVTAALVAMVRPVERQDRVVTAHELAGVLGVTVEQVRAMARRGDIRTVRRGARRVVPWTEVERLVAECEAAR